MANENAPIGKDHVTIAVSGAYGARRWISENLRVAEWCFWG